MANLYVTGPCHIYVAPTRVFASSSGTMAPYLFSGTSASAMYYLGTCEQPPRVIIEPKWKPLYADIGGDETPFDKAWMGEEGTVVGVLTRWNEAVYAKCAAKPRPTGTRGTYTAGDVGTLMYAEALAYPLWLHFPFGAAKNFNSLYGMPNGYRFIAALLVSDGIEPGTKAGKRGIMFSAGPVYKPSDGTWKLYDHDMTNIPSIPPTIATGAIV